MERHLLKRDLDDRIKLIISNIGFADFKIAKQHP